ncbi:conserved hypothetical protein, partial [Ricinus communis]
HCEANTARSGGAIFSSVAFRVRFHTPSASSVLARERPTSLGNSDRAPLRCWYPDSTRLHVQLRRHSNLECVVWELGSPPGNSLCSRFSSISVLLQSRVLRRIAWGEYDWTQGNALEILVRLAAEGIGRDVMTADFHQNFEHVADEAKRYAIGPLLHRAKFELRVAAIVSELNSVAGWCEVVYELKGRNRVRARVPPFEPSLLARD